MSNYKDFQGKKYQSEEFKSAEPATPLVHRPAGTGLVVERDGTYLCKNCSPAIDPLRAYLKKGDEYPACPTCGPDAHWEWCSSDVLHCD